MIKLVAFDWNGTLFADTYTGYISTKEVFKILNLEFISYKTFVQHFEIPVKNFYMALGASEEELIAKTSIIQSTFHPNYEQKAAKVRTRAHAKKLLQWLKREQINSIIFSNHPEDPLKKQLKRLKIESYFDAVIANSHIDNAFKGRNKKEKLKEYLKDKGYLAKEILIVGDTTEEIEIGKQLNVTAVAITHGNCSILRLKRAKPDFLISNLKEIIDIIKSKNLYQKNRSTL